MKVKLFCKDENYERNLQELLDGKITISETEADFYIVERGHYMNSIIGKCGEEFTIIKPEDILYVESYGNDVVCTTQDKQYSIREKLFEIELMFSQKGFIRVNKSYVINVNHLKTIRPTINMKYVVRMSNAVDIDVTRTYYYQFKEYIGL